MRSFLSEHEIEIRAKHAVGLVHHVSLAGLNHNPASVFVGRLFLSEPTDKAKLASLEDSVRNLSKERNLERSKILTCLDGSVEHYPEEEPCERNRAAHNQCKK